MSFSTARHRHPRGGFTILEILVATAVLALIMLLIVQIISSSGDTIGHTRRKLDAAAQARLFLDRLGMDLAARVAREDAPLEISNPAGDDSLRFYAEAAGYQGDRNISLIGYRINAAGAQDRRHRAERGATGGDWTGAATLPLGSASPPAAIDADYEVLSDGVFRMEIRYQKKSDGSLTDIRPASTGDIAALVVAVAAIDDQGRRLLSDAQLGQLAGALPDPPAGQDPLSAWKGAMAQPGFAAGLPLRALRSVDVYQRYYPFP